MTPDNRFGRKAERSRTAGSPPPSPHVIYRPGETERPTFHNSFVERHWPKFFAVAAAILMAGFYFSGSMTHSPRNAITGALAIVVAGGLTYVSMESLRHSLNALHATRTQLFRSKSFTVGALAALGLFFLRYGPNPATGADDFSLAIARVSDPLFALRDGFQRKDLDSVVILLLRIAVWMGIGGGIAHWGAKRLGGKIGS